MPVRSAPSSSSRLRRSVVRSCLEQVCTGRELHLFRSALSPLISETNAGAPGMVVSQFREMDPADWDRFVAVNLYGVLNCSRSVIEGMCERGWGRVITISSGAGVTGMRMGISIYAAAKSGGIGFMRHLAMEVARFGVTANTLALGLMGVQELTDLTRDTARQIPVGRLGSPDDVGAACAYLASDEAAWMIGQTINLNGGSVTT